MSEFQITIGKTIKKYRLEKDLSQEDLAALCSLHRTYIGSVERGERNISLNNIITISRALGIKPSTLLQGIN